MQQRKGTQTRSSGQQCRRRCARGTVQETIGKCATDDMQRARGKMQLTTRSVQQTTSIQHAACSGQYAANNKRHAPRNMRQTSSNMQRTTATCDATRSMQHATGNEQHATDNVEFWNRPLTTGNKAACGIHREDGQRVQQTTCNAQQTACKRTRAHARCNRKHAARPHFVCGEQGAADKQQFARSIVLDNQRATRHGTDNIRPVPQHAANTRVTDTTQQAWKRTR